MPADHRKSHSPEPRCGPQNDYPITCSSLELDPVSQPMYVSKRSPLSETGEVTDLSALTFRQRAALPIIACSPTIAWAARASGVGESTLRRWLADPAFGEQVACLRRESAQLARQELHDLMPLCASVFADAMQDPDPALRLRAARYALSFIIRISEVEKLDADVQDLEATSRLS